MQQFLDIPDLPHGLLLIGLNKAAKWINGLSVKDQFLLVDYLKQENSTSAQLQLGKLLELVMLAEISENSTFLPLLNK